MSSMHRPIAFRLRPAPDLQPRLLRSAVAIASIALVAATLFRAPVAAGATGDIGYEDQSYSGTSEPTGTKRAESVLWWNDGSWWANMWDTATSDFHIFRLDLATQTWLNTGTPTDGRTNSHADVLWAGGHLYVASHLTIPDENAAVSGYPSYLYRFSYSAATKTYSLDAGFPVQINNYKTETLVIDRDSTGKLWATWQQDNKIFLNRTIGGDDHVWGTPFQLPVTATDVTIDDNSAVIAFHGDKVGVMWSNQSTSNDAMWFAVHDDGQPDTSWSAARTAIQGSNTADDHMNLKSIQADGSGRVYAAIKTSFTNSAQPLIMLLVRDTVTGDWANYPIARVSDCPNRPLVLIDEQNRMLHAFYSAPAPTAYACNSSGGEIDEKTSSLDSIAFPVGAGTPVILDYGTVKVHNASSTKQNVNSQTGIVVLARNNDTDHYWHHYESIGGSAPPAPVAAFTGSPTSGTAPLNVQFTDQSTNNPTSWSWTFGDGGTSTSQSPSHTYTTAGTYNVTLTASNSGGSDPETKTNYISASTGPTAPTANFTGTPTSGAAPLVVQFSDTSTGGPTSWSWSFGDGGTSTLQSPSHTYQSAGMYTVTLTASNSGGSDGETKANYITASTGPTAPVAAFTGNPTSGTAPLTVSFTDQSTNSPTSWSWTFGDGGTSTLQNPSHTYQSAGPYTVTLTASNSGGSDGETKTNYISVSSPVVAPVPNFTGTPLSGTAPLLVQFTDTSTNTPTSWSWTFGDGGTSTQQNPSHTYSAGGTYTVGLTATNSGGSNTLSRPGYITVADFSVAAAPSKQIIVRGSPTSYDVTVTSVVGFSGTVSLTMSGNPTGVTGSFTATTVTVAPGSPGTATLNVATTTSAKVGSYTLTIRGTSGGLQRTATVTLQLKRK